MMMRGLRFYLTKAGKKAYFCYTSKNVIRYAICFSSFRAIDVKDPTLQWSVVYRSGTGSLFNTGVFHAFFVFSRPY